MISIANVKATDPNSVSSQAADMFRDFYSANQRELLEYSRSFLVPIQASDNPNVIAKWVIPHDPRDRQDITKEYEVFDQTIKVAFMKSHYNEIDPRTKNTRKITVLIPKYNTPVYLKSLWMYHELGKDLEPSKIPMLAITEEFRDMSIKDSNGRELVGFKMALEYEGIERGANEAIQKRIHEISSVKKFNHATQVLYHIRQAELYKALYSIITNDKVQKIKEVYNLSKLGVDTFMMQDIDSTVNNSSDIIRGTSYEAPVWNPAEHISTQLDSSVLQTAGITGLDENTATLNNPSPVRGGRFTKKA